MKAYLRGWNLARALRLVFGLVILVSGIIDGEWIEMVFGAMLSLLPLLSAGCCANGYCNSSPGTCGKS